MVVSMEVTTAVRRDACWAGQMADLTEALSAASWDAPWVGLTDASTVEYSAARSVVCSVASKVVMSVAPTDER